MYNGGGVAVIAAEYSVPSYEGKKFFQEETT